MKLSQTLRLTGIFFVLLIGFAFTQSIPVSLPDTASGDPGVSVTVPIIVGDLTGRNVISYQGTLTYDSNILTATGVSTAGTISDGLTIFPNIQPGQITLGTFSTDPLSGSGVLVNINFDVNAAALPGQTTPLTLQDFIFNAGDPPVTLQNGLFTVTGDPDISVNPSSHDFGDVLVNSSATQTFVVSNEGTADLVVSATTLTGANPGEFSITGGGAPFTLAPGATQDVVVSFNPTSTGAKSATLSIESNDPDENPFDVPLSGNGVPVPVPDIAVNPTSHDYGDVLVGSSASQTFVVSNEGTADLVVSATTLTGANPGEFSITSGGAPFTLAPGATQDVVVSFNPTSTGAKSATLSIESNDPDENPLDVPLSGNGIGIPDIAVSPTSHDFGNVLVGSSASQTFVVSNEGTADLVVSATTLTGTNVDEFSITSGSAPFTLAPGATQDVVVGYNPTSAGAKSANLSIHSNDPDENPLDVPLSGSGLSALVVASIVPDTTVASPGEAITIAINFDMTGMPAPNNLLGSFTGTLNWEPTVLQYTGNSGVLQGFTGFVNDMNAANGEIIFNGAKVTGQGGVFDILQISFSFSGDSSDLDLEFSALSSTSFLDLLPYLNTKDGFVKAGIPDIAVSPLSHNYGDVIVGSNTSQTFVVSNEGTANLVVSSATLTGADPGEFSIVSGGAPFTLAPGATQDVMVSFNPTSTGPKSATLSIQNNDPDENPFEVPLSGNGIGIPDIAVSPASHDYGDVLVGSSASQTFVVSNEGTADLVVSATTLTGADPGEFSITGGGAPFTLAPGATQDVMVSFNPTSTGAKSATLSIQNNDPDETPFDVPLSGNGIGIPDIAVFPTSHDYGDVLVGSSASQTFVVSNEGTADLVVSATTLTGADPGEFSIVSGGAPFTLAPGATQDVVVSFNPTSTGPKSATLSIESNDPDENPFEAPLSGNGIAAPSVLGYVDCPGSPPQNCPFTVEIKVDMAGAAPPNHLLGSFSATLSWNPALLDYTGNSGLLSGFSGLIDDANANNGIITFNGDNLAGAGGLVDLLNVDFEATGASGSAATLDLEFSAMAAAQTSLNLLPFLTVNDCSVSITESALLGDVNGDNQVNSTDALVILSYDAGIPIPQPFLDRINAGLGDVNFDALTNSTDALIVLSYDAGIPVPFPLGDPLCPPMVASPGGREREN